MAEAQDVVVDLCAESPPSAKRARPYAQVHPWSQD